MAIHGAAIDGADGHAAVVAGEDDQRLLAQVHLVERGDELADGLVEVADVVGVERVFAIVFALSRTFDFLPAAFLAVRRCQNRPVDERCRVINEERPIAVAFDEVHDELVKHIGRITCVGHRHGLAVLVERGLPVAFALGFVPTQKFVPAPSAPFLRRFEVRKLAPFARERCRVTGLLEYLRDADFLVRLRGRAAAVVEHAGAERVTTEHAQRSRRRTKRRGVTSLKPHAARREGVEVRRLERPAVTAHTRDAVVVGKDEDDIGLVRRGGLLNSVRRSHQYHQQESERCQCVFHSFSFCRNAAK